MDKLSMAIWIVVLLFTGRVQSHGRLWEPPSRSSMWRRGYNTTVNINDNELNCGGFQVIIPVCMAIMKEAQYNSYLEFGL